MSIFTLIVIVAVISAGTLFYSRKILSGARDSNREFLLRHPDAARVYLAARASITSEAVEVHSVNGGKPETFFENGKSGFLLVPGTASVEVSYSHTRPGILHRNVVTTTDVVKKELVAEPGRSYLLGFDRSENVFTFAEFSPEKS